MKFAFPWLNEKCEPCLLSSGNARRSSGLCLDCFSAVARMSRREAVTVPRDRAQSVTAWSLVPTVVSLDVEGDTEVTGVTLSR